MSEPAESSRRWWQAAVALIPAVVVFHLFAADFRARNSVTIDETAYLTAAKPLFTRGDFGPLAYYGTAPMPVLLEYGPAIALHGDRVSDSLWQPTPDDPQAVGVARVTTAWVVGTPLLALVVGWVYVRTGKAWLAGWAGLMTASSPTVIGFTAVAGTDACFALFFLLALLAVGWYSDRPTVWRFAAAGAAVGLAISAKYSGVLALPAAYVAGLVAYFRNADKPTAGGFFARALFWHPLRLLGFSAGACVVAWAASGFTLSKEPFLPPPPPGAPPGGVLVTALRTVRLPSPIEGFAMQGMMSSAVGPKEIVPWLNGESCPDGHRLYYLFAILYKSTPAELAGMAFVLGWPITVVTRRRKLELTTAGWGVVVGLGVLFVALSLTSKQFGLRYFLPAYPAVAVATAVVLGRSGACRRALTWSFAGLLVGGQLVFAALAAPWHISHLNALAGTPTGDAHRRPIQEGDWGQGWIELRRHLDEAGETGVLVLGVRTPVVECYSGVRCLTWERYGSPPCRFICMSANGYRLNPAWRPRTRFFLSLRPSAVVADCVYLYDTSDPDVWAAYQKAVLEPEFVVPKS